MPIIINGTTVDKVIYNGTTLDKVMRNGSEVFSSKTAKYIIQNGVIVDNTDGFISTHNGYVEGKSNYNDWPEPKIVNVSSTTTLNSKVLDEYNVYWDYYYSYGTGNYGNGTVWVNGTQVFYQNGLGGNKEATVRWSTGNILTMTVSGKAQHNVTYLASTSVIVGIANIYIVPR